MYLRNSWYVACGAMNWPRDLSTGRYSARISYFSARLMETLWHWRTDVPIGISRYIWEASSATPSNVDTMEWRSTAPDDAYSCPVRKQFRRMLAVRAISD